MSADVLSTCPGPPLAREDARRFGRPRALPRGAAALLLAAHAAMAQAWSAPAVPPPLRDQLGREQGLARQRGAPVIALVVTAARLRSLRGFETGLRKRAPGVSFLRVADVPEQPRVEYEAVARKLRGRVPPEVGIGIDLGRSWSAAYGLDTSEVNALVFSPEGELLARFRGRRSDALLDAVAAAARQAAAGAEARP